MLKILLHIFVVAGTLLLLNHFVPGIYVAGFGTALLVALLWGIIGVTIKPALNLLALPVNFITLGLFSFIINALLFWLLSALTPGFYLAGFIPALEGSLILSFVALVLHALL